MTQHTHKSTTMPDNLPKKSKNLHTAKDSMEIRRAKSLDLLEEVAELYEKHPAFVIREMQKPDGYFSNIDQNEDAYIGMIIDGVAVSPKYDVKMAPLADIKTHDDEHHGHTLLEMVNKMSHASQVAETKYISNMRPSTQKPAVRALFLKRMRDGRSFQTGYFTEEHCPHTTPHPHTSKLRR